MRARAYRERGESCTVLSISSPNPIPVVLLFSHTVASPAGVTVAVGIGFANEKVGYFAGGANGAGTEILKTEDAGVTWDVIPGINFGLDVLLLGKYLFFCFFLNPFFLFFLAERVGMPCHAIVQPPAHRLISRALSASGYSHFEGTVCFWVPAYDVLYISLLFFLSLYFP